VSFLPVLSCVFGVFNSPVVTPVHGLLGLNLGLRLRFVSKRRACLLWIFVPPLTVPLHQVLNSGPFLWTSSLFIYFRSMSGLFRSCFLGFDLNKTTWFVIGVLSASLALYSGSSIRVRAALKYFWNIIHIRLNVFWSDLHRAGVFDLFKHVAQLINRGSVAHRLYNISNATTVAHVQSGYKNN